MSLLSPRSGDSVRSSSAPARRLYPTMSAARIAAIFRVPTMAPPHAPCRIAQRPPRAARLSIESDLAEEGAPSHCANGGFGSNHEGGSQAGRCGHEPDGLEARHRHRGDLVVKDIERRAKRVQSSEEIAQIGTIGSHRDKSIGKMIAEAGCFDP